MMVRMTTESELQTMKKADEVLELMEREPAQSVTTEILAREVRRLRAAQGRSRYAALVALYMEAPDDSPEEQALEVAMDHVRARLGLDTIEQLEQT